MLVLTKEEKKTIVEERKEISQLVSAVVDSSKKLLEIDNEGLYSVGAIFTRKDYSTVRELLVKVHDNLIIKTN